MGEGGEETEPKTGEPEQGDAPAAAETDKTDKTTPAQTKDRRERSRVSTKIVCRRLPPNMTEESFLEQVSPIPDHDYFYFVKPDPSLAPDLFSRAYINFLNIDDIFLFRDRFDDYIFLDDKGNEYPAVVEYAPFQRMPKKRRKKDLRSGTLETDSTYLEFLESLKEIDSDAREPKMEYSYQPTEEKKETTTPLLDYLAARKKEERKRREERQQRRRPRNRNSKDDDEEEFKIIKSRDNDDKLDTIDDDDVENIDGKDAHHQGKGRGRNFKDSKQSFEGRKKSEYNKKEKLDPDNIDYEKSQRKERKQQMRENYKERNKEKFADKKEKTKYSDRKQDKVSKEEKDVKPSEKKVFSISVKSSPDKVAPAAKSPSLISSKIKPFTTLPQLKTEELSKMIDELDINSKKSVKADIVGKNEESPVIANVKKSESPATDRDSSEKDVSEKSEPRRKSLESKEKEKTDGENVLKRHKSLEDKSDQSEKSKENDPRLERRIRNKDRPSLAIYQPGMGKFSKHRLEREVKDPAGKSVSSHHSSSNSVNSQD